MRATKTRRHRRTYSAGIGDDFSVTQVKTPISAGGGLHPFGLTFNSTSVTAQCRPILRQELQDLEFGVVGYGARMYMPSWEIGEGGSHVENTNRLIHILTTILIP